MVKHFFAALLLLAAAELISAECTEKHNDKRPASMGDRKVRAVHIIPLLTKNKEAVAADLKSLHEGGALTDAAFSFTLVPEGNPPVDKAAELGRRFQEMRSALKEFGGRTGILAQATMGHGYALASPSAFQKLVRMDGGTMEICCPLDSGFRKYLTETFKTLAALKPDFLMIDDDFRLLSWRNGCLCPLHLAEFNRRNNSSLNREELNALLQSETPEGRHAAELFDEVNSDSLAGCAVLIREAVDSVDPGIRIDLCTCSEDIRYAARAARILAGTCHTPSVRLNNARYMHEGLRHFAGRMYHTAAQIAALDGIPEILAEPDTYPQNRYSTSAVMLHALYAFSLLEGCNGGKHWITRMCDYEPASGEAYRKLLIQYSGFHREAERIGRKIRYAGGATPLPEKPFFDYNPVRGGVLSFKPWSAELFGRMGIPAHFVRDPEAAFLTGAEVGSFSDTEISAFLKRGLLLDGEAAYKLCERGFSDRIGVKVEPLKTRVSRERLVNQNSILVTAPEKPWRLIPLAGAETDSELLSAPWGQSQEFSPVAPGSVRFTNADGGRVVTFAGGIGGFSFLNESRKAQLLRLCNWLTPFPCWYSGDAELYLKAGKTPEGKTVAAMLNLSFDPEEEIRLDGIVSRPGSLEELQPDGTWKNVPFTWQDAQLKIPLPLLPGMARIIRWQ